MKENVLFSFFIVNHLSHLRWEHTTHFSCRSVIVWRWSFLKWKCMWRKSHKNRASLYFLKDRITYSAVTGQLTQYDFYQPWLFWSISGFCIPIFFLIRMDSLHELCTPLALNGTHLTLSYNQLIPHPESAPAKSGIKAFRFPMTILKRALHFSPCFKLTSTFEQLNFKFDFEPQCFPLKEEYKMYECPRSAGALEWGNSQGRDIFSSEIEK